MAELIDEVIETAEEESEISELPSHPTEQTQDTETPVEAVEEAVDNPTIPEKYQNKTTAELVEMHQNAERALGKQGGEVGELRKIVDDYITAQVPTQPQETMKPADDVDFFTKPNEAVDSAIDNHPAIKEAKEASAAMRMETARNHVLTKHPDIKETLADPKFADWVSSSPYRKRQYAQAEVNSDLDAVDELMTGWAERKDFVQQTVQTETESRNDSVKAASTGNTKPSSGGSRKPVFRRADIIKLINEDPDRYEALLPEIEAAYRDKRVR